MPVHAEMQIVYPRDSTGTTSHTDFYFEVLQTALEYTRDEFGSYSLRYSERSMNPARAAVELEVANGRIQVDVRSWTTEREKSLYPVPFPVDRGLIGYRVLLIRADKQSEFESVRTLDDLRKFSFGLLTPWSDVKIFEHNGLPVVRGTSFDGLFMMLNAGRFEAFSRDIDEVQFEFDQKRTELPQLAIERTLLLHYPSARYFFVSRTPDGMLLAERIKAGLDKMQRDGRFDELFRKHKDEQFIRLKLGERRVIHLANPLRPPGLPELPSDILPSPPLLRRQ